MKIDKVKFRQKVIPGDAFVMRLEAKEPMRRGIITMQGYGFVKDRLVVEAELTAQVLKRN